MLSTPSFSVIIPVYNCTPWLRECLDSVSTQTFQDWECICVDDGSADESGAILDEYALRDPRFRVFHQENSGASAARNAGLDKARGDFFLFVDGDDAIVPDSLACFQQALETTGTDALLCYPEDQFLSIDRYREEPPGVRILSRKQQPVDLLTGPFAAHGYVVSRVYRRSLFGDLRFPEDVRICEDTRFWADALCVPAQWTVIDKP